MKHPLDSPVQGEIVDRCHCGDIRQEDVRLTETRAEKFQALKRFTP